MKELRALTPEEFDRIADRLKHPPQGGRIEAAKRFGIDLSLLISQLRLTPAERAERLEQTSEQLGPLRGILRRKS